MRALIYKGEKNLKLQKIHFPELKNGEALIQVAYAGICGTDLNIFEGKHPRAKSPLIMGHEFTGILFQLKGKARKDLSVGQKVVIMPLLFCGNCRPCKEGYPHVCKNLRIIGVDTDGGFAEYVKVPQENVCPLPNSVSLRKGALVEPLAVGVHVLNRVPYHIRDIVVVSGFGPIGLIIALLLKKSGLRRIYIAEINGFRIDRAKELGFEVIDANETNPIDFILKETNGDGADVVFEASGAPSSIGKVTQMVRCHGTVMLIGIPKEIPRMDIADSIFKELSILTSRVYSKRDFDAALEMMAEGNFDGLEKMTTEEFMLEEGDRAFQFAVNSQNNQFKVLLKANRKNGISN